MDLNVLSFYDNPWDVNDVSVFLKYCCPECDFINSDLETFCDHALRDHIKSTVLFKSKQIQESSDISHVVKTENNEDDFVDYAEPYIHENKQWNHENIKEFVSEEQDSYSGKNM